MEFISLGNSDLRVSRLCIGGCPLGGYGWGEVDRGELIRTVQTAVDREINFFDTADIYGLGQSEETLGTALKGNRSRAVLATKFGVRIKNGKTFYDNSPDWILQAAQESMKRLQTDYIDLYQIHYRDGITGIASILDTLDTLKSKGYIRYYGLSNLYRKDMPEIKPFADRFVSFQDEYSLACRKNETDMRELSENLGLTPLTWGSLGQGILTGKYNKTSEFSDNDRRSREAYVNFHGEQLDKNLKIVEVLRQISRENGRQLPSLAIRFILDHMRSSVVIAGVKNEQQLLGNLSSMDFHLTEEQLNTLLAISG